MKTFSTNNSMRTFTKVLSNCLLLFLLTMVPAALLAQKNVTTSISNDKSIISVKDGKNNFRVEVKGSIELSENDDDVIGLSRGGYFEVSKKAFGKSRKVKIEPGNNGQLVKTYYEGRKKISFVPDGQKWLAEILQELVQTTTIGAAGRGNRIYNNGGVNAILREMENLEEGHVRATYFDFLMDEDVDVSELPIIIKEAGRQIESDYYLAELLSDHQRSFLSNERSLSAYIAATQNIRSDHYKAEVMENAIQNRRISNEQLSDLLDISKSIRSDHYLSETLEDIINSRSLDGENLAQVIRITQDIGSDHYKSEVLKRALRSDNISKESYIPILETISNIRSDHYIADVIQVLVNKQLTNQDLEQLLSIVKTTMDSNHYISEVMMDIADNSLSEAQLITMLEATSTISSDHYLAEVLEELSDQVNRSSDAVKDAYRAAAKKISSSHYYKEAMDELDN